MMNNELPSQLENRSYVSNMENSSKQHSFHSSMYRFKEIEHVIQLAHRLPLPFFNSQLIAFENSYYLVIMYPEQKVNTQKQWVESLVLEYGERAQVTIFRLQEYGKIIMAENAVATIKNYFERLS